MGSVNPSTTGASPLRQGNKALKWLVLTGTVDTACVLQLIDFQWKQYRAGVCHRMPGV